MMFPEVKQRVPGKDFFFLVWASQKHFYKHVRGVFPENCGRGKMGCGQRPVPISPMEHEEASSARARLQGQGEWGVAVGAQNLGPRPGPAGQETLSPPSPR